MIAKLFSAKPSQVRAVQLLLHTDPDSDNAQEIADWCKGRAVWNYDSEEGERVVTVSGVGQTDIYHAEMGDWIVRTVDGVFSSMSDSDFREKFDTEPFNAPPTCQHCLSDPRHTPMGDPDEKRCPVCGVRYQGPRRNKEYSVLVASGLVAREED